LQANILSLKNGRRPVPRWQRLLEDSITDAERLADCFEVDTDTIRTVANRYPLQINPYYLSLIRNARDPLGRQVVPDIRELDDPQESADPLTEDAQSPVPGLIHRYPDRVVLLASNRCAVLCRFCLRKRFVGRGLPVSAQTIRDGIDYIAQHSGIKEVIVSGGDPLLLDDIALRNLLTRIRAIDHVIFIRIHSRVPCTLPQRVTTDLAAMLKTFHPLFLNTHFNHPAEITPQATTACQRLADAGIPLGCQTVLLKGINDDPRIMRQLMYSLLAARVRPYYLHHADPVRGTRHFRTTLEQGLDIMASLRGFCSGMALPQYMIDLPGGGGKVPLLPESVIAKHPGAWIIQNHAGRCFAYPC
jgi:lysine 2,3-aminomutase